jgi:hypothetical protein
MFGGCDFSFLEFKLIHFSMHVLFQGVARGHHLGLIFGVMLRSNVFYFKLTSTLHPSASCSVMWA